jgi:hypothetical protein
VRVAAGVQTAATSCRDLISAEACSASLAEWNAAHLVLMRAVGDGEVEGSPSFDGTGNYWFDNLYVPFRKVCLGAEDYDVVKRQLEQAKGVGVIETVEAIEVPGKPPRSLPLYRSRKTKATERGAERKRASEGALLREEWRRFRPADETYP